MGYVMRVEDGHLLLVNLAASVCGPVECAAGAPRDAVTIVRDDAESK